MDIYIKQDKFHKVVYKKYSVNKIDKTTQTLRNLFCYYSELACEKYNNEWIMNDYLGYLYDAKYKVNLTTIGLYSLIEYSLFAVDPEYINDENYTMDILEQAFNDFMIPHFDKVLFERAKEIYESDLLSSTENQSRNSLKNTLSYYFKGTNRDFSPNGSLDELYNITLEDLVNYYEVIKKEESLSIFSGNYKNHKDHSNITLKPKTNYNFTERNEVSNYFYEKHDTKQTYLNIIYETNTYANDKDYYSTTVINYILGGSPSSLLFNIVREKYGYCYGIRSLYLGATGIIIISATIDYCNLEKVINAIEEAFEILESGDFDLESAILHFKSNILVGEDYIETKIGHFLTDNYFLDTPKSDFELKNYEDITKDSIFKALQKMKRTLVYVYGGEE